MLDRIVNAGRSLDDLSVTSMTLVTAAQNGDEQAWKTLVEKYGPVIYLWCRIDGIRGEQAYEIGQEVLTSVARGIVRFRKEKPEDTFRGWLRRITQNKIKDYWKRPQRKTEADVVGGSSHQRMLNEIPASEESSVAVPERVTALPEVLEEVKQACEERTWRIFVSFAIERISAREVAVEFSVNIDYVYQVRSRILHRLRKAFEARGL